MADQWFVQRNGKKFGPYSSAQMRQFAASGKLLPIELVQREDGGKWFPASQIKGLFTASPPAVQPPPIPQETPPAVPEATAPRRVPVSSEPLSKDRMPTGLMPPFIGLAVILGIALLTCLYVIGVLLNQNLREETRNGVLICMSFLQTALAIFGVGQTFFPGRRFVFAVLGCLLAMSVWGWFIFSTLPIALSLLGTLAGMIVGIWGLVILKSPEVQAQFPHPNLPVESLWQQHTAPVIGGAVGGGSLAIMVCIGFLLWLTTGERGLDSYRGNYDRELRELRDVRESRDVAPSRDIKAPREIRPPREIKNRTGGPVDDPTEEGTEDNDYQAGYQTGQRVGTGYARTFGQAPAAAREGLRSDFVKSLRQFEKEYQDCLRNQGPNNSGTRRSQGIADGFRKALQEGGVL